MRIRRLENQKDGSRVMLLESIKTEGVLTPLKYQKPGDEQRAAPSFRRVQCYVWRGCIVAHSCDSKQVLPRPNTRWYNSYTHFTRGVAG